MSAVRHRLSAAVITACCIAAPLALTASAPIVIEGTVTEQDGVVGNCGDFLVLTNGTGTTRTTIFVDGSDVPTRILFQGRFRGTLTNSVTGASLVDAPSVANITIDLVDGTQTNVGPFFNITAPGEGGVYFQTGRIVFPLAGGAPIFIAGQQPPPPVFLATICDALR